MSFAGWHSHGSAWFSKVLEGFEAFLDLLGVFHGVWRHSEEISCLLSDYKGLMKFRGVF